MNEENIRKLEILSIKHKRIRVENAIREKRELMKRYLLFAGNLFYPNGGAEDFVKDFDEFEECLSYLNKEVDCPFFCMKEVWGNIMDTYDGTIKKYSTPCFISKNHANNIPFTENEY